MAKAAKGTEQPCATAVTVKHRVVFISPAGTRGGAAHPGAVSGARSPASPARFWAASTVPSSPQEVWPRHAEPEVTAARGKVW